MKREQHGKTGTALHNIWLNMKDRCNNPNNDAYDRYGGRGIKVCALWQQSFTAFEADIGPRPSEKHTIDRSDNSKGYEPGNCLWATRKEQTRNRAMTVRDLDGKPIAEIAEGIGMDYFSVQKRFQAGDRGERLSRPRRIRHPDQVVKYRGETMTIAEAARAAGVVERTTARNRLRLGWTVEAAVETPARLSSQQQADLALAEWQSHRRFRA